ncbi:MAG: hypothetical protein VYC39_10545 [Myxococcota bacterium]|nr:hypothetical protein [Myxococcota bacterium]
MNQIPDDPFDGIVKISHKELNLLRFTCDLIPCNESPLSSQLSISNSEGFGDSAQTLLEKSLVEERTFRPKRELLRRLLIASQPDARIVLTKRNLNQTNLLFDAFERASTFMELQSNKQAISLGVPRGKSWLYKRVRGFFTARSSGGDLIELKMSLPEYFVFSLVAKETSNTAKPRAHPKRSMSHSESLGPSVVMSDSVDEEGSLQRLAKKLSLDFEKSGSVVQPFEWLKALESLEKKGVIMRRKDSHALRPFLRDLSDGLTQRSRYVLTRFDYLAQEWVTRDLTLLSVPGSVFMLQTHANSVIHIKELDAQELDKKLASVIYSPDF